MHIQILLIITLAPTQWMADCVFSPSLAGGAGSAAHLEGQLDGLGVEVEASSDHVVRGLHMGQLAAVQLPHQHRQRE